ncbi:S8 family serine peptidase [Peterkaempfera bronchialis]|uniref:S8 family serine peptidase n=1 Tax=Peterkaempfera bronchialis TaxID=2126346 RepID=UPI001E3D4730|nr:S8 family serine peptidase [Peterkaempfera bronchialis]
MVFRRRSRLIGLVLGPVVAAAVLTGAAPGLAASPPSAPTDGPGADGPAAAGPYTDGLYIVQLAEAPVASYGGGIRGLAATRPQPGGKVDPGSSATRSYRGHLEARRKQVLARVPGVRPVYAYDYAFNGFAARLTARQAARLAAEQGVVSLERNQLLDVDTVSTARFLGLSGSGGVWERRFGGAAHAGEGVVIGMVDSGYSPDSPLFAPLPEPRPDARAIARTWKGTCDHGEQAPVTCNNKVIGARYYHQGVTPVAGEYLSPRDYGGHGTHTASTAAGDSGVPVVINGNAVGEATGMAPAARLAIYKACWVVDADNNLSCGTADTVAAVNQAVADGVDVINYSVSGSTGSVVNSVESAFYNAAHAGVFVATGAGNTGTAGSVSHNAPWEMTVAASTHDRRYRATLALGDGRSFTGVGTGAAVESAPLVTASAVGRDGANSGQVSECWSGTLDPVKAAGAIVVCRRGGNDRTEKSAAVQEAGGVGMVLYNPTANSLDADFHHVPTVHLDQVAGAQVAAYAATPGATASLAASEVWTAPAPAMADFSSTGPASAGGGDLLKPDVTAPGVDVIAGVAPDTADGNGFGAMSGTSMAAPHVAGLAALLLSRHPGWSPAEVQSALMTTAYTTDNQGGPIKDAAGRTATPFSYGSGHVDPARAFDPGLVYRAGQRDWQEYACAIGQQLPAVTGARDCARVRRTDPSDLNYPSLAVAALAGRQTLVRTVTNVDSRRASYRVQVDAPPGFTAEVRPAAFTLRPGKSARYRVTLTRTTAPLGSWAFGALTWTDGTHAVRSPIAVKPVALAPAPEAAGHGTRGSMALRPQAGYAGTLNARVRGLSPAEVTVHPLRNATGVAFDTARPTVGDHTASRSVTVPAGTKLLRFGTFADDYRRGTDVDLYLYKQSATGALTLYATAATAGTATEAVQVRSPAAGQWVVYADLRSAPADAGDTRVAVDGWLLDGSTAGNAIAAPESAAVAIGDRPRFRLSWSGLEPGHRYLGSVVWDDGAVVQGYTEVQAATG